MQVKANHGLSSIVQHPVSVGIISTFQAFNFPVEIFNKAAKEEINIKSKPEIYN